MTPTEHYAAAEDLIETARLQFEDLVEGGATNSDTAWRRAIIDSATGMAAVHATLAAIPQRFR